MLFEAEQGKAGSQLDQAAGQYNEDSLALNTAKAAERICCLADAVPELATIKDAAEHHGGAANMENLEVFINHAEKVYHMRKISKIYHTVSQDKIPMRTGLVSTIRLLVCLLALPGRLVAGDLSSGQGVGDLANSLMVPLTAGTGLMVAFSLTAGVLCLLFALVRARQFRDNPPVQPGSILLLSLMGILLFLLVFSWHMPMRYFRNCLFG